MIGRRSLSAGLLVAVLLVVALRRCGVADEPEVAPPPAPESAVPVPIETHDPPARRARVKPPKPPKSLSASVETDVVSVTFRDLADGSIIPFDVLDPKWPSALGAQAESAVGSHAPREDVESDAVKVAEPFHFVGRTPDAEGSEHYDLWVYRTVRVRGTVSAAAELNVEPRTATVEWGVYGGGVGQLGHRADPPWSTKWLNTHRLRRRIPIWTVTEDGSFECDVSRVRGLTFVASVRVPGRATRNDVQRVAVDSQTELVTLRLEIQPEMMIAGVLVQIDGTPATGRVAVFVHNRVRAAELDHAILTLYGIGVAGGVRQRPTDEFVTFTSVDSVQTSSDGHFELPVFNAGRTMLTVKVAGFITEQISLGEINGSREDLRITLRPDDSSITVTLRDGDAAFEVGTALVVAGSAEVGQPEIGRYTPDANGRVNASVFEEGKDYYLILDVSGESRRRGWLTWRSQSEIDVSRDLRRTR